MAKTTICYFTGTGNTLYLAKRFAGATLADITKINEGRAEIPLDTKRLGILFPVYMGGVPYPVREFVSKYLGERDNSGLKYIFAAATCGAGGKSAEWMIDTLLQNIGLALSYSLSIKFPDSYIPLMKTLPDEAKAKDILEKSEEKILTLLKDTENEEIKLPGKPFFGKLMLKMNGKTGPSSPDKKMKRGEGCTSCGLCASICPSGNIKITEKGAEIGEKCLHCYACYNFCTTGSITYEGRSDKYKGIVEVGELRKR
ncbi:MAG: EFR1 family ferrodoxin [Candidatus Ornithospirochaeta sp.]